MTSDGLFRDDRIGLFGDEAGGAESAMVVNRTSAGHDREPIIVAGAPPPLDAPRDA